MGTGAVATLLNAIPYPAQWLHILSIFFFVLNLLLWTTLFLLSCLRYYMYPELWGALLRNPKQRLFLGTVPTGFATILNLIIPICGQWGQGMVVCAWVLWWVNSVVSVGLCFWLTLVVFVFPPWKPEWG
jgi:tellurite resistance protein TehA-like permease